MEELEHPPNQPVLTLTFHGIGDPQRPLAPGEEEVWLARDTFLRVLDTIPRDAGVEITFDDGNGSDVEHAMPALLDRGLRGTFFVVAGHIGHSGYVSASDLDALVRSGMEIGSHGMCHRPWRGMSDEVAREEIIEAKSRLEQMIRVPVKKAACPFGTYDREALKRLRAAEFETVFTSDRGRGRRNHWLRARNTIRSFDPPTIVAELLSESTLGWNAWVRTAKRLVKRLR